ncbi:MAG: hypothetical protein N3A55_02255 [Methylohalobius sp.]|nr:hypothetical protein [Methylohalobius sp.]
MKKVRINFQLAVWLSVLGGLLLLFNPKWVFSKQVMDYYGHVNLVFMAPIFFLIALQVWLWLFYYSTPDWRPVAFMGGLFLLAAAGVGLFYAATNLPVRLFLPLGLVYCGLSHLAEAYRRKVQG